VLGRTYNCGVATFGLVMGAFGILMGLIGLAIAGLSRRQTARYGVASRSTESDTSPTYRSMWLGQMEFQTVTPL